MKDQIDLRRELLLQQDAPAPAVSPDVEYIEYILEDEYIPEIVPRELASVVYDKELSLSNLYDNEVRWLALELSVAEIAHRMRRPPVVGTFDEEIALSTLPGKQYIKLARSRKGFERIQQTTQTIVKAVTGGSGSEQKRWRLFGHEKKKEEE